MIIALILLASPFPPGQEPAPTGADPQNNSPSAEALREQIHGMRQTILMGGDSVRGSEKEAVRFLQNKITSVDKRLDYLQAERIQMQTSYDLALDRAGRSASPSSQEAALVEASKIKTELQGLASESEQLQARRKSLVAEQARIEERRREREGLAAQMDAQGLEAEFTPFLSDGVGLGPEAAVPQNPLLTDPEMREDFLRRYPVRGRQLVFEADPVEYWRRWPLTPPSEWIGGSMIFPAPDLPGRR